jgi:hypothetical protein
MAIANIRERLALHFDAEASLDSRVTRDGYEVHIRIPYRTAKPGADDSKTPRREPYVGNGMHKRLEPHPIRSLPATLAAKVSHG